MSHTDAPMLSGRHRPIRGFSKARRLFKKQFWTPSGEPVLYGDVHIACQLRETSLTDGDVGHYICELMDYALIVVISVLAGHESY